MWKKIFTAIGISLVLVAMNIGEIFGRSAGDTIFQSRSSDGVSVTQLPSEADAPVQFQQVENLNIKYPSPFSLNGDESKNIISALPIGLQNQIKLISVYSSEPTCGIGEIRIIRVMYSSEVELNIDTTSAGAIKQVSTLDGIVNLEKSISSIKVSGYPARKVSFKANRWGGTLGGEFLFIEDTDSKTIWQLQLLFASQNSNHEKLKYARSCANEVLKNTSIVRRTKNYGALIDEMSRKCELVFDGQSHEECCKEKNIKNCPNPQASSNTQTQPHRWSLTENVGKFTKEGLHALVVIATILVIFLATRKRWIQNLLAYFSETTKATFTGGVIWIFIVLSYVTLISPYGYIDNDDLFNLTLWCLLPPVLTLAIFLWVKRFVQPQK